MYSPPTDNVTPSQPLLMRFLVRSWEFSNPHVWVGVRFALGIWNLVLGVLLVALAYWRGASFCYRLGALVLGGAALLFWTCYRLQQIRREVTPRLRFRLLVFLVLSRRHRDSRC